MAAPALQTGHVTVYQGDALGVLRELPAESVDCCVTSPPYWGLRDYGTATWEGGSADCDHKIGRFERGGLSQKQASNGGSGGDEARGTCPKCGARRIDAQLGLEPTPAEYVQKMVEVFREVRRVLADHGTLWLNLGDSYAGAGPSGASYQSATTKAREGKTRDGNFAISATLADRGLTYADKKPIPPIGLKSKDMVGIPWRVAFALQADGWYLRSDIIWAKPNPMPESVTDRPTKSHEYVFLLSKGERYFFDQEAVREESSPTFDNLRRAAAGYVKTPSPKERERDAAGLQPGLTGAYGVGRNIRTVWTIATQPYPEAHFATFPRELPERCIKAGCPEQVCATCGKARERITSVEYVKSPVHGAGSIVGQRGASRDDTHLTGGRANKESIGGMPRLNKEVTTTGWTNCGHDTYRPGVALDPFAGSGTTLAVARDIGRKSIGIELNPAYVRHIEKRCGQEALDFSA